MFLEHKMYLDPLDSLALATTGGNFEKYTREIFEDSVKEGNIVLDLGAHLGYYTLIAARKVGPRGKVFAFEPAPINLDFLKKNVDANNYSQRVTIVPKAISDAGGSGKLFLETLDSTMGYRMGRAPDDPAVKSVVVETISLDEFFIDYKEPISVIKMDIEGMEFKALRGMQKLLSKNKNIKIISEFDSRKLVLCGTDPIKYLRALKDLAFELTEINEKEKKLKPLMIEEFPSRLSSQKKILINILCVRS